MSALIEGYDAALFDLDGVIYLGPQAVPGAVAALSALRAHRTTVMFVTNNAARPAQVVIDQLTELGIAADDASVLTSAQVAASALAAEWPRGTKALVSGSTNLAGLLGEAGFQIVEDADDHPAIVVQGYDPDLSWRRLDEATLAIQAGARWYATNSDASRPTDRGLVPGVGGAIAVIATALGQSPEVFGKPHLPMLREAISRTGARRPIFVGDRLDTDISGAQRAGIDSLLVLSGAHGKFDLASSNEVHPTYIGRDVGALLLPPRIAEHTPDGIRCGEQFATATDGRLQLVGDHRDIDSQLDALWAALQLVWADPRIDARAALESLELLP
ncbi:MAG: hydrolase [Actinobacteria bacterium HGW-Actinobacteria-2]|nr:MAG: hydrolase [Actinobacteria bacterium HGW-Actinobacteria-2]